MPRFKPGQPKPPNSGRRKGPGNKISSELREFLGSILDDEVYRKNLKRRALTGKLHPTLERLARMAPKERRSRGAPTP